MGSLLYHSGLLKATSFMILATITSFSTSNWSRLPPSPHCTKKYDPTTRTWPVIALCCTCSNYINTPIPPKKYKQNKTNRKKQYPQLKPPLECTHYLSYPWVYYQWSVSVSYIHFPDTFLNCGQNYKTWLDASISYKNTSSKCHPVLIP